MGLDTPADPHLAPYYENIVQNAKNEPTPLKDE